MLTVPPGLQSSTLLKETLASELKGAITEGRLSPGQRVVESKWAGEFGVAQASIREAINLLIAEGFLVKLAGRSARVVNYRERDIAHIYEVRAALEGLAAQLACTSGADLSPLERALQSMENAVQTRDMKKIIESDLEFHTALVQAPGNRLLADIGRKLLYPLFAFIEMRVVRSGQGPTAWIDDLGYHRGILHIIREGNSSLASQFVQHCIGRFAASAYAVWENVDGSVEAHHKGKPSRGRKGKS
ncbi:MAG TPA: GntR family transcriptional regulator [Bryobacteraceae bacterium]|nr:GntR family transcriptional regulator [Bryobacteraceae bacterium]